MCRRRAAGGKPVEESVQVDRFHQVVVAAGLAALLAVALLTVSGYRDDQDVAKIAEPADRAGAVVTVHPRQAGIEQDPNRSEAAGGGGPHGAAVRDRPLRPL